MNYRSLAGFLLSLAYSRGKTYQPGPDTKIGPESPLPGASLHCPGRLSVYYRAADLRRRLHGSSSRRSSTEWLYA